MLTDSANMNSPQEQDIVPEAAPVVSVSPSAAAPEEQPRIARRDMVLIGVGLAILCVGKIADSAINSVGSADVVELQTAALRLQAIPQSIGFWESTDNTLTEREIDAAGIAGYIRREYHNPATGYTINLTVLCGHSGPMSVHPPTACFEGVGYTLASGPSVTTVKSIESGFVYEFNKSSFRQGDAAVPEIVRVFWAWAPNGEWAAPENPRIAFRGRPYLYKIYVTDRALEDHSNTALPQIETFLKDALPALSEALGS
jgi:hypothetical protein